MNVIKEKNIEQRFHKSAEYFASKREDLFSLIPSECKKILDVGCGSGEFWKTFNGEVTGIELNEEAAEKARKHLHAVHSGDLEKNDFKLAPSSFDCIIFADVLEHLYDPWGVLLKFRSYLRDGGYLLISVPNIRNYRVLRSLLFKGEFGYEESGILDIDHIRFFTRKEVETLLNSTGYQINKIQRNFMASSKYILANKLFLGLWNDFLTGQFYVLAQKKGALTSPAP